jgi:hypothetical protein
MIYNSPFRLLTAPSTSSFLESESHHNIIVTNFKNAPKNPAESLAAPLSASPFIPGIDPQVLAVVGPSL